MNIEIFTIDLKQSLDRVLLFSGEAIYRQFLELTTTLGCPEFRLEAKLKRNEAKIVFFVKISRNNPQKLREKSFEVL